MERWRSDRCVVSDQAIAVRVTETWMCASCKIKLFFQWKSPNSDRNLANMRNSKFDNMVVTWKLYKKVLHKLVLTWYFMEVLSVLYYTLFFLPNWLILTANIYRNFQSITLCFIFNTVKMISLKRNYPEFNWKQISEIEIWSNYRTEMNERCQNFSDELSAMDLYTFALFELSSTR